MHPPILNRTEKRLLSEVKRDLEKLLGKRLVRVVLFGSRARGDASPNSDIDVAIIVAGLPRKLRRTIYEVIADVEIKYNRFFSALLFSKQDFDRLLRRERRLALDILNEGIPL